jgi:sporulation protein YlmC with PRC-barrel domain
MRDLARTTLLAGAATLAVTGLAYGADESGTTVDIIPQAAINLNDWDYETLYEDGTWTAEQLIDADVYGSGGEEIGEVENIIIGTDGQTEAIIAEVGGFWDIGDTHVRVPWSEVEIEWAEDETRVRIPVTEETVDQYDVFGGVDGEFRVVEEDDPNTPRGWRVTELIDDYVTLKDDQRYGYVDDLVFRENGKLEAVVVDAAYPGVVGPFAYPYYGYGYGFHPGYNYYRLPYGEADISDLKPFDYDNL